MTILRKVALPLDEKGKAGSKVAASVFVVTIFRLRFTYSLKASGKVFIS